MYDNSDALSVLNDTDCIMKIIEITAAVTLLVAGVAGLCLPIEKVALCLEKIYYFIYDRYYSNNNIIVHQNNTNEINGDNVLNLDDVEVVESNNNFYNDVL